MKVKARNKLTRREAMSRKDEKHRRQRAHRMRIARQWNWRLDKLKINHEGAYETLFEQWVLVASEHWDADYMIDDFVERMDEIGIDIRHNAVSFSGFCSQGDGASYAGYVTPDVKFFQAHPELYDDYAVIADMAPDLDVICITRDGSRYSHKHTMGLDNSEFIRTTDPEEWEEHYEIADGIFKGMKMRDACNLHTEDDMDEFCDTVLEICRSYADELYEALEAQYEYETGRECFDEHLLDFGFEYDKETEEVLMV